MAATEAMGAMVASPSPKKRRIAGNFRLVTTTLCLSVWTAAAAAAPSITVLPIPPDPSELVTGPVQSADRESALKLLEQARDRFALRGANQGYDLKVNFTVDSGGQTNYDGSWEMDDINVPGQGLHWTAKSPKGYSITRISMPLGIFSEGTATSVPLRLQEARGLLNHPLPSLDYASRGSIRIATATFKGATLTCLLLSRLQHPSNPPVGRGWDEAEECIDAQSGRLQVHSEVPGRYVVYDYSNGFSLGDRMVPRSITVIEAGRVVSRISVESLTPASNPDPRLFAITGAMHSAGAAVSIAGAERLSRVHQPRKLTSGMKLRAVCVFGVLTPGGQLVEAHSLQPSDPASDTAILDAQSIDYSPLAAPGSPPAQRFVFVIEKFLSKP